MAAHPTIPDHPDLALSLALAVVGSASSPLLLLDGTLAVVAASASFCEAFHLDPLAVPGRKVFELGDGEWAAPQLTSLLKATASGAAGIAAYEMDLADGEPPLRRLVINAHKLAYGDAENVRLLVAVADLTDARARDKQKDDLLREKAILLRELQHRIANSLQIVASILMQSARRVQSEEARSHLHSAQQRIMSVAALQQQLAVTTLHDVELSAYFAELCQSLGASMIRDKALISLEVRVDRAYRPADVSVSLGLIITELVINALKHAFPDHRGGKIKVEFHVKGTAWTLTVGDDGIGMPSGPNAKPGLGTSIVEALARQLEARVDIVDADPGTIVSVVHS